MNVNKLEAVAVAAFAVASCSTASAQSSNRTFLGSVYVYLSAAGQRCPNLSFDQKAFLARASGAGFDINGADEKATVQKETAARLASFEAEKRTAECSTALNAFGPNGTTLPGMLKPK